MNFLPINVANTKATVDNTSVKSPLLSSGESQAIVFNDVLSDSLAQHTLVAEALPVETPVIESALLSTLSTPLPIGGQELPPAGTELPPELAATIVSEGEVDTALLSPLLSEKAVGVATAVSQPGITLNPEQGVANANQQVQQATTVAQAIHATLTTASLSAEAGQMKGVTVLGTAPAIEAEIATQTNTALNQKPVTALVQGQTAVQGMQENNMLSSGGGQQSSSNGENGQRQFSSLPEIPVGKIEDKIDFSRIIEKGLAQTGREISGVNPALTVEPGSRTAIESLKSPMETLQLQQHIDKPKWSQEFGSRLVWMTKEGVQNAQIRLTPAHLGTIEVKISIQNDQANVSFLSQHGAVKDMIEASMPRLREMMNEAGVKLDQVNVSTNNQAQQDKQQAGHLSDQHRDQHPDRSFAAEEDDQMSSEVMISESGEILSAVDYYA